MKRRNFLKGTLVFGASLLSPTLSACGDDEIRAVKQTVIKGPFVQFTAPKEATLRFETRIDEPLAIELVRSLNGVDQRTVVQSQRRTTELDYRRPVLGKESLPDEVGLHALHEVVIADLQPGERVTYTIRGLEPESITGHFLAGVEPGANFRFGWIADTMYPFGAESLKRLVDEGPDLVIHGGDIVYDDNIFDSWNGVMTKLAQLSSTATMHVLVGNHEHERNDEFTKQYLRLFQNQGEYGDQTRYFAFNFGSVAFICLDSEAKELDDVTSDQMVWLVETLERVSTDANIEHIVVSFHRPLFTFSTHAPKSTAVRDTLHPLFLEYGVRIVLAGHVHAYERFLVDGIHYIVDGGGGALLYDPDHDLAFIEEERPEEIPLRKISSKSYGVSTLDFLTDGSIEYQRIDAVSGEVMDTLSISKS